MLSEHILFVIERITDILKVKEEKKVRLSDDVKRGSLELLRELSRIYDYLRDVDSKYDNNQELSDHERQFYLHLSSIVDSSDDILDRVMSEDDDGDAHDINTLVEKIRNSYNPYSTPYQFKLVGGNAIMVGQQSLANVNFSINSSKGKQGSRPKSFGHYPNPYLVGFKHEIQTLLTHLLQPYYDETRFVGIVGMGGSGKTTLAKHIYHHPVIKSHFSCKVWVCISQSWDKTSILNQIWRQAIGNHMTPALGYDLIVDQLYAFLSSQSYLMIVDDIWSIDAWYDIYPAFPNKRGSKVVITTRNKFLPNCIDPNVLIVEPKPLSNEESYELFMRKTFLTNERIPSDLIPLGKEMVEKCKGLPLAINALADMLKMHKNPSNWERISERLTHHILNMGNDPTQGAVKDILALSYYELPLHLKQCVLYLHVFPENYKIEAQKLIQMWIAECFVDEEFVAKEYLEEMVQRCIVEVVKTNYKGQVRQFQIHDLFHRMLVDINQERGLLKDTLRLGPWTTFYLHGSSHVRSLLLLDFEDRCNLKLQPLVIKLRLLRVLILNYIPMKELPEEIGLLIHLRYLEMSGNPYHLPRSIGNLENLLTIDIKNLYTSKVQINLEKLKELRHLYIPMTRFHGAIEVEMEVLKLEKLKKLKTLWGAKGGEWMLLGMPNLSAALQELSVLDIKSEEQLMALFRTPSITSNNLQTLVLMWDDIVTKLSHFELCDMSILIKCESLRKLKLWGQIGVSIQIMFPPNLIKLEMAHTHIEERELMNIISKSCPHLRILVLRDSAYMGSELVSNANSFPQLVKLKLEVMSNLKLWIIEETALPRLHHLFIEGCENMDLNPQGWTCISKIPQLECKDPSSKFGEKLRAYTIEGMEVETQEQCVEHCFIMT